MNKTCRGEQETTAPCLVIGEELDDRIVAQEPEKTYEKSYQKICCRFDFHLDMILISNVEYHTFRPCVLA